MEILIFSQHDGEYFLKLFLVAILLLLALLIACTLITQFLAAIARRKIPPTGKFTEVTGGKIHWTDTGEGETILLLHGLGGNSHNFNYMIPELAKHYRVISVDRIGSGWSTRESLDFAGIDSQSNAIVDFIEKEQLQSPLLVGHSLGGAFSISIGIKFPKKIRGLALICPASMAMERIPKIFRDLEVNNSFARTFLANVLSGPFGLMKQKEFLTEIFKPEPVDADFDVKGGAILSRLPSQFKTTCEDLIAAHASQGEIVSQLGDLRVMTHVLFGEDDAILDAHLHGTAFCKMTGAKLIMIPKTGHMLPITQPQLCNKFIHDVMSVTA